MIILAFVTSISSLESEAPYYYHPLKSNALGASITMQKFTVSGQRPSPLSSPQGLRQQKMTMTASKTQDQEVTCRPGEATINNQ